jgi:AmmeMemoRadiSam system protein A
MANESAPVALARQSLDHYLARRGTLPPPTDLSPELAGKAGVFVSLKKHGQLRGCIGTFAPTQPNVAAEIIQNAVSAGTQDPRFPPVDAAELPELDISVDILSEPERADGLADLDPKRYGVIVRRGRRSGLLLPDLEGVDRVEEQVAIAMQKAGISPAEEIELYRFSVTRYS